MAADANAAAIGEHEFEAAVSMLKLLAIRSPHRAQEILDEINVGLRMARRSTNRGPS